MRIELLVKLCKSFFRFRRTNCSWKIIIHLMVIAPYIALKWADRKFTFQGMYLFMFIHIIVKNRKKEKKLSKEKIVKSNNEFNKICIFDEVKLSFYWAYFSSDRLYFLIITILMLINYKPNFPFRQWKSLITSWKIFSFGPFKSLLEK